MATTTKITSTKQVRPELTDDGDLVTDYAY